MGCDIHVMVEYDPARLSPDSSEVLPEGRRGQAFAGVQEIRSLAPGGFSVDRDPALFAALAGVQHTSDYPAPLIAPRGFPATAGADVFGAFHRCIQERSDPQRYARCIWRDDAERALAAGRSSPATSPWDCRPWLTDPEFHSPSWLVRAEILAALQHHGLATDRIGIGFRIVLEALRLLEAEYGAGHARCVFWFDG